MNIIFYSICYLSFLLIVGVIIRSKVKIFQELFIPASVIGGVVGLIIGNFIIPIEWIKEIRMFPGLLIIPIVTSIPLGFNFKNKNSKSKGKDVVLMTGIMLMVTFFQLFIGYFINFFFEKIGGIKLYKSFGSELNSGLSGGHGTAGMIGRVLKELNMEYWYLAQGIATVIATFGLIGGIVLGIFLINKNSKNGKITFFLENNNINEELKKGYIKDIERQPSLGRETLFPSLLDTLAFHIAIIFSVCGLSYLVLNFIKAKKIPILSSFSVWIFGMGIMFVVWSIIKNRGLEWCIDVKVKSKISGFLTEFAIVSAVSTLQLNIITTYFFPIFLMISLGFLGTWFIIKYYSYKVFLNNYSFERAIAMLGTCLGIFFTGLLLLKICDPEFSTPVLGDYSLGFSFSALLGPLLITNFTVLAINYNAMVPMITSLIFFVILIFIMKIVDSKK